MARKRRTKKETKASQERAKQRKKEHAEFLDASSMQSFARSHDPAKCKGEKKKCNDFAGKIGSPAGTPPKAMNGDYEAAVHHVLPVSAVTRFIKLYATKKTQRLNIASCYSKMEWCINKKANLMWLPYFPAYQRHLAARDPGSAPHSMAAHNFDHNPHYNDRVIEKLKPYWAKMSSTAPTQECKKAEELVEALDNMIQPFKDDLTGRSTQPILNRAEKYKQDHAGKSPSDPDNVRSSPTSAPLFESWYTPFSLAKGGKVTWKPAALLFTKPPRRKVRAAIKRKTEARS